MHRMPIDRIYLTAWLKGSSIHLGGNDLVAGTEYHHGKQANNEPHTDTREPRKAATLWGRRIGGFGNNRLG
jgi:hypothetical protein